MVEGSGSVPLTKGSGSGGLKTYDATFHSAKIAKNRLSTGKKKRNKLSSVYVLAFRCHMARLEEDLKALLSSSK
jgi:hypothetical protein